MVSGALGCSTGFSISRSQMGLECSLRGNAVNACLSLFSNSMAPRLDPAIVKALSLDDAVSSIVSHGSSNFSSTAKITSQVNGEEKVYFVKTGTGQGAETMFAGECGVFTAVLRTVTFSSGDAALHERAQALASCYVLRSLLQRILRICIRILSNSLQITCCQII